MRVPSGLGKLEVIGGSWWLEMGGGSGWWWLGGKRQTVKVTSTVVTGKTTVQFRVLKVGSFVSLQTLIAHHHIKATIASQIGEKSSFDYRRFVTTKGWAGAER
jgi:hypothetical protein